MVSAFKQLLSNQYEATLCTLSTCIERCPEAAWNAPVVNLKFCQVAFHTLFFTDYYLGENPEALREQAFHGENLPFFRDYEELEDRKQKLLYDRPSIQVYLEHCRNKAASVIAAETSETFSARCGFPRWDVSRGELYVFTIRHIQHHSAQLSLRLRIDTQENIPWVGSGWCEV